MNNSHFVILNEDANPFAIVNKNFGYENIIAAIEDEMGEPVDSINPINNVNELISYYDSIEFKATTNGITRTYFLKPIFLY